MGKLANISGKDAAKAFQKAGWQVRGQVDKPRSFCGMRKQFSQQGMGNLQPPA